MPVTAAAAVVAVLVGATSLPNLAEVNLTRCAPAWT
jgi:hypothetical protein